jgi:hypothetical protein
MPRGSAAALTARLRPACAGELTRKGWPVRVRGRTFVGLGKDETTAVFCINEQEADHAAAADPGACQAVRRGDARRSFLGLQVELASLPPQRIRPLVEEAWRQQAPKRLAAERSRSR